MSVPTSARARPRVEECDGSAGRAKRAPQVRLSFFRQEQWHTMQPQDAVHPLPSCVRKPSLPPPRLAARVDVSPLEDDQSSDSDSQPSPSLSSSQATSDDDGCSTSSGTSSSGSSKACVKRIGSRRRKEAGARPVARRGNVRRGSWGRAAFDSISRFCTETPAAPPCRSREEKKLEEECKLRSTSKEALECASSEEGVAAACPAVVGNGTSDFGRTAAVLSAAARCLEAMQAKEGGSVKRFYQRRTSHPRWPQMRRLLTGASSQDVKPSASSKRLGAAAPLDLTSIPLVEFEANGAFEAAELAQPSIGPWGQDQINLVDWHEARIAKRVMADANRAEEKPRRGVTSAVAKPGLEAPSSSGPARASISELARSRSMRRSTKSQPPPPTTPPASVPSTNLAPFSGNSPASACGGGGAPSAAASSCGPIPSATECIDSVDHPRGMPPMRTSSPAPTLKLPASSHYRGNEEGGALSTASAHSDAQTHASSHKRPFQSSSRLSRCDSEPGSGSDRPRADNHCSNGNPPIQTSKEHRASHAAAFQELHGPMFERSSQFTLVPPHSSIACWGGTHPTLGRVASAGEEAAPVTASVSGGGIHHNNLGHQSKPQGGVSPTPTHMQQVPGLRGEGAQPTSLHTAASWTEPSNFFRRSGTNTASQPSAMGAFNIASNIILERRSSFSDPSKTRTGIRSGTTSSITVGHPIHNPAGQKSAHDPVLGMAASQPSMGFTVRRMYNVMGRPSTASSNVLKAPTSRPATEDEEFSEFRSALRGMQQRRAHARPVTPTAIAHSMRPPLHNDIPLHGKHRVNSTRGPSKSWSLAPASQTNDRGSALVWQMYQQHTKHAV